MKFEALFLLRFLYIFRWFWLWKRKMWKWNCVNREKKQWICCFVSSGKLEECLMKTDKVNNETLLVKGSVQTEKKHSRKTTGNTEEWTTGQWLVQKQTINARSHNDMKNRREDFSYGNAIPRNEKIVLSNNEMCFNKRNCLSNLQTQENATTSLEMLVHLLLSFLIFFFF